MMTVQITSVQSTWQTTGGGRLALAVTATATAPLQQQQQQRCLPSFVPLVVCWLTGNIEVFAKIRPKRLRRISLLGQGSRRVQGSLRHWDVRRKSELALSSLGYGQILRTLGQTWPEYQCYFKGNSGGAQWSGQGAVTWSGGLPYLQSHCANVDTVYILENPYRVPQKSWRTARRLNTWEWVDRRKSSVADGTVHPPAGSPGGDLGMHIDGAQAVRRSMDSCGFLARRKTVGQGTPTLP